MVCFFRFFTKVNLIAGVRTRVMIRQEGLRSTAVEPGFSPRGAEVGLMVVGDCLGGDRLVWAEAGPFVGFGNKALAAHHIPFHFSTAVANVDVDFGLDGFKGGGKGQMGLFMLGFDGMVGEAAIHVGAVNTDTHGRV